MLAVDGVDLALQRGEVLALLGENGAGKTTLMNMLFGRYLPDAGWIEVAGPDGALHPLQLGRPQAALDAGIGMVHQHFTLAEALSVIDNILLGAETLWTLRRRRGAAREKIARIMRESGLTADLDARVGDLSVGERQRVEILKALYRDARVLVLDEPTAVLTPQEADALFENVARMAARGLSVIFISHKLREVLAFSGRIAVLRHGRKVGEMATAEADIRRIAEMMVGAPRDGAARARPSAVRPDAPPALVLSAVDAQAGGSALRGAELVVRAGEIVGVAGVSGNGQGALAALISGLARPDAGSMTLGGAAVSQFDPGAMIRAGVGRIPEDRHRDGVAGGMSVSENFASERLGAPDISRAGLLDRGAMRRNAEHLSAAYDVRGPGVEADARLLSGGNIQKLILARVLNAEPALILANQPTRGLDLAAADAVATRLRAACERGAGVVLISEDLDEILSLSDRVVVIHDGRLAEAGPSEGLDRGHVGLLMAGQAAQGLANGGPSGPSRTPSRSLR